MFKYSSGAPSEVRSAPLRTCPPGNTTPHHAQAWLLWVKLKLEAKVRSVRWAGRLLFPPHACLQVTIHFLSHSSLPLTRAAHHCEQKDDGNSCGACNAIWSSLRTSSKAGLSFYICIYSCLKVNNHYKLLMQTLVTNYFFKVLLCLKHMLACRSACNLDLTHLIRMHNGSYFPTNGNAKMNNMTWVDGPVNSVYNKKLNSSMTAIQQDLNLTDLTGLPNPLRRADTLKAIFQVDTCSALRTRAGGTFIHVCNINTKSCYVLQIWKTHLKLCF